MKHTIPAENLPEVQKHLARLAVKAARYGKTLSYTVGAEYPYTVRVMTSCPPDYATLREVDHYTVSAVDIDIDADIIQRDGWTVAAYLEHTDAGNIVTAIDGDILPTWHTIGAYCDHCGTNRARMYTYIVRDEDGNYKQVGKQCLRDYTGIDADIAASLVALQEYIIADDIASEGYTPDGYRARYAHVYTAREVLAAAVACIAKKGYIKSADQNSTKEQIIRALDDCNGCAYTPDNMSTAKAIMDYLIAYTGDDDILCNARIMAASDICKPSQVGRLAYVPVAFAREQERAAKALERASVDAVSAHVGNVGERLTLSVVDCALLTSWETAYGTTYLYKMHDISGNVFVWFASSRFAGNAPCTIKATVKAHDERDNVKQTIITRCKVV